MHDTINRFRNENEMVSKKNLQCTSTKAINCIKTLISKINQLFYRRTTQPKALKLWH